MEHAFSCKSFDHDALMLIHLHEFSSRCQCFFRNNAGHPIGLAWNLNVIARSQRGKSFHSNLCESIYGNQIDIAGSTEQGVFKSCQDGNHNTLIFDEFGGALRSYGQGLYTGTWFRQLQKLSDDRLVMHGRRLASEEVNDIEWPCFGLLTLLTPDDMEMGACRDLFLNGWWNRFAFVMDMEPVQKHENPLGARHRIPPFDEEKLGRIHTLQGLAQEVEFPPEQADWFNSYFKDKPLEDAWWDKAKMRILKIAAALAILDSSMRGEVFIVRKCDWDEACRLTDISRNGFETYYSVSSDPKMTVVESTIRKAKKITRAELTHKCSGYGIKAREINDYVSTLMQAHVIYKLQSDKKDDKTITYIWMDEENE